MTATIDQQRHEHLAETIREVDVRRAVGNRLVHPSFRYQAAWREILRARRENPKFDVYEDDTGLIAWGVTFNHATGILYRNQRYGFDPVHSVFDIQRGLRSGCAIVADKWAVPHAYDR